MQQQNNYVGLRRIGDAYRTLGYAAAGNILSIILSYPISMMVTALIYPRTIITFYIAFGGAIVIAFALNFAYLIVLIKELFSEARTSSNEALLRHARYLVVCCFMIIAMAIMFPLLYFSPYMIIPTGLTGAQTAFFMSRRITIMLLPPIFLALIGSPIELNETGKLLSIFSDTNVRKWKDYSGDEGVHFFKASARITIVTAILGIIFLILALFDVNMITPFIFSLIQVFTFIALIVHILMALLTGVKGLFRLGDGFLALYRMRIKESKEGGQQQEEQQLPFFYSSQAVYDPRQPSETPYGTFPEGSGLGFSIDQSPVYPPQAGVEPGWRALFCPNCGVKLIVRAMTTPPFRCHACGSVFSA